MTAAAADSLRVGGTGAATEMLRYVGAAFVRENPGNTVEVVPSLGSSGAIGAVGDGVLAFAVSGRPLKPDEAAKGLTGVAFARTPFGLVTSHPTPNGIDSITAARFFASETSRWADGQPVRPILRPRSESDTTVLGQILPGMASAIEQVRARAYVPVAATDQDNANMAERIPGSLVGATYTQIKMEKRDLRFVAIDGVAPSLESFERGVYRYGKDFYFVFRNPPSASVQRFIAFLRTPAGHQALRESGNLPVEPAAER
jgi:phosphate transport system substrate-binding protein